MVRLLLLEPDSLLPFVISCSHEKRESESQRTLTCPLWPQGAAVKEGLTGRLLGGTKASCLQGSTSMSPGSKTEPTKRGQQLLREVEKRDASP